MRSKSPVKPDHQQTRFGLGNPSPFDLVDLFRGERERLFDKHVLAGFQGTADEPGVAVVARRDGDGVDGRVG
jgi:hypothetical protein